MSLNQEEVDQVARLARIEFPQTEQNFTSDLTEIIDYVAELDQAPTENIEVTHQISNLKNIARPDEIKSGLSVQEVLMNAPAKQGGFIKTKNVFE